MWQVPALRPSLVTLGLVSAVLLLTAAPVRATTLAGDSLTVSLACYSNPACTSATATSPLVVTLPGWTFTAPVGTAGFSFNSNSFAPHFSQHVVGSFTNFIDSNDTTGNFTINFLVETPTGGDADLSPGGFIGLYVTATDPSANPLLITFAGMGASTTDGFTLAGNVTYPTNPVPLEALNFAGLTGTAGHFTAQLDIEDVTQGAAVPEPATAALLATGLLGLLGLGLRRRITWLDC